MDVFLQHYPACWDGLCGPKWREEVEGDWRDSWRAMEDAYEVGALKAIGVSNVDAGQLEELLGFARVKPHVVCGAERRGAFGMRFPQPRDPRTIHAAAAASPQPPWLPHRVVRPASLIA